MSLLMAVLGWVVLLVSTFHVDVVSESGRSGLTNHHHHQVHAQVRCIERERLALLTFNQGLHHHYVAGGWYYDQQYDSLASWTSNKDCCSWTEIRCDNLTNHVMMLHLSNYGIGGLIGPSLLELQYLEHLDLSSNYFTQIPKFIGSFKRLKYLDLSRNPLGGTIPTQLGNLTKLQYLKLGKATDDDNSQMIVDNLGWLSHLPSLSSFVLHGTNFTKAGLESFQIPSSLSSLELWNCHFPEVDTSSLSHTNSSNSLKTLYMVANSIHSTTINWLLNSSADLVELSLDCYYVIGVMNRFNLRHLSKLKYLYIYQTIADSFEWLSHLSSLTTFSLVHANFTKHRLQSFKMPPSLSSLMFMDCQFPEVNSIPSLSSPNSSNSLTNLELRFNTIHPTMLTWLFNSSANLVNLTIKDNFIDGSLPNSFQKMTSLVNFQLTSNTGLGNVIPNSLGNLTKVKTLDLSFNNFNGSLQDLLESLLGCSRKSLEILSLQENKFRGSLLDDDKTFLSLRELDLSYNLLEGLSPNCLSRFPNLINFNLNGNQLTELPDFTILPSLRVFCASNNRLNGSLPESIGQFHNLEVLFLNSNSLSGVVSEVHFQKLSNLKELDLSSNSLTLSFNSNWVPPFHLTYLSLSSCKLGPQFPRWLHNQLNLSSLDISNSGISGAIPSWFSQQTWKLVYLDLSSNLLNSTLPNLLMMSDNNCPVNLSSNKLHGSLPISLSNASWLSLSNNKLSGLRSFLCDQKNGATRILDLSNNMLSGSLPDCWWNLKDLQVLILEDNELSGKIPSSIRFLHHLLYLNLRNNSFAGSLLSSLKNCTKIQVLDAGENNLKEEIPSWIGESLMNLVFLSLKSNRLHGTIPSNICKLQFLQIMDLSINNISGAIPTCIDNFTSMVQCKDRGEDDRFISLDVPMGKSSGFSVLTVAFIVWKGKQYKYKEILGLLRIIDLSSNRLTGVIPKELENLAELVQLNLSRNNLSGAIPTNIGKMSKLESLDLSHNDLSGKIPISLAQVSTLDYLDLSNNQLSGRIPTGTQLQSFNASAYDRNLQLCGQPLTPTCPGDETSQVPLNSDESYDDDDDNGEWYDMSWLRMGIGVGFAVGFCGVCGNLLFSTTLRLAYFRFMDNMGDWLYVVIFVKWAMLKRRFSA